MSDKTLDAMTLVHAAARAADDFGGIESWHRDYAKGFAMAIQVFADLPELNEAARRELAEIASRARTVECDCCGQSFLASQVEIDTPSPCGCAGAMISGDAETPVYIRVDDEVSMGDCQACRIDAAKRASGYATALADACARAGIFPGPLFFRARKEFIQLYDKPKLSPIKEGSRVEESEPIVISDARRGAVS